MLMVVAVGVVLAGWLCWPRESIWDRFDRIRLGMTVVEVEEILGGPARDHTTTSPRILVRGLRSTLVTGVPASYRTRDMRRWIFDGDVVIVGFSDHGTLVWKHHDRPVRSTGVQWVDRVIVELLIWIKERHRARDVRTSLTGPPPASFIGMGFHPSPG
jgi:hypothetical protein